MSTELVSDNMNIFRAFSEGMHNDNLRVRRDTTGRPVLCPRGQQLSAMVLNE